MQARCACGDAVLHVTGPVHLSGLCHCTNCRRRTGSALGWSVYVREDHARLPGGLTP